MKPTKRPSQVIPEIVREARDSEDVDVALKKLQKAFGSGFTMPAVDGALRRAGKPILNHLVMKPKRTSPGSPKRSLADAAKTVNAQVARQREARKLAAATREASTVKTSTIEDLFKLTRKGPLAFAEICNRLDLSPARAKALVSEAKLSGVRIRVENDHVGFDAPTANDKIQDTKIAPTVGKRQMIAVITDLHLGSKYCLRAQLRDFINDAYDKGVRDVLSVGDNLDGDYRHGKFEMSHMGISEQTRDLFEVLPQHPGLRYHCITGNHDFTFTEESGVDVGDYVTNYFAKRGRDDIAFYGDRSAFIKIRGAVINMWHPSGGVSYAVSYKMQKKIESYSSGMKPQILLVGHWHRFCYIIERGVHAIACGTFQGGGSAFSKSLTSGAPAIGGQIVSYTVTRDGTLRDFILERRNYFEVETAIRVDGNEDGIPVARGK